MMWATFLVMVVISLLIVAISLVMVATSSVKANLETLQKISDFEKVLTFCNYDSTVTLLHPSLITFFFRLGERMKPPTHVLALDLTGAVSATYVM